MPRQHPYLARVGLVLALSLLVTASRTWGQPSGNLPPFAQMPGEALPAPRRLAILLMPSGSAARPPTGALRGTTWYVVPGSRGSMCTQAQPCGTINAGVARLRSGDTLILAGGTYTNECLGDGTTAGVAPIPPGTSWRTPTTVTAAPGATVILRATQQCAGGNAPITLDNPASQYIVLDGLHVIGTGTFQLMVLGSRRIRFQNMILSHGREAIAGAPSENIFEDVTVQGSGFNESGAHVCPVPEVGCHGVYFYGGRNNRFTRLTSRRNTGMGVVLSCDGCPSDTQPTGNVVDQSQLSDNHNAGFYARQGNVLRNSVVSRNHNGGGGYADLINNTFVDNTNTELVGGTRASVGIAVHGGSGQQVHNNRVLGHTGGDIQTATTGASYSQNLCGQADPTVGCALAPAAGR